MWCILLNCKGFDVSCSKCANLSVSVVKHLPISFKSNRVLPALPAMMESLDSLAFLGPQAPLDLLALVE